MLPEVRARLAALAPASAERWAKVKLGRRRLTYLVKAISGDTLDIDPFRLLADEIPGARENMGDHTLVVVGARDGSGPPSFFVLDHAANARLHDEANGEELLGGDCQ